ncbi:hypothetical protein PFICI_05802 [Pestalotiopsis fici W106-1]|uniref:Tyrosine specific protein phosphatases domain-containing protein n=1 Tax=Pestalotiopsis fici (strain W106-1 / CGMCC3.15140) TaxID=1229662 RepID=W3XFD5_PESFW|nr:uncharacterized protein PFICI_05802 [Pestalotiopsis fici W106-1]ETS83926.1 hypothetical protein PFICI_05802 [Pestalotiopsis fici W106-1]
MAQTSRSKSHDVSNPEETDPALLRDHTQFRNYKIKNFDFPKVRVFFRPRPKIDEFPQHPATLPLLVFIHGLGGQASQFSGLISSLCNNASCLAVDLPGCGRSAFSPQHWKAYEPTVMVALLETIIQEYRDGEHNQGVILIGHSMGSVLAARLANPGASHDTDLTPHILGVIGICPQSGPPSEKASSKLRKLLWLPTWLFDLLRRWDRRGGTNSPSVLRIAGREAHRELRELQYVFNRQSSSPVFRRFAWGCLSSYTAGQPVGGLFGEPTWAGLNLPVYLIGAKNDNITQPEEVDKIKALINDQEENSTANSGAKESQKVPQHISTNEVLTKTSSSNSSGAFGEATIPALTNTKPREKLPQSISDITAENFQPKGPTANSEDSSDEVITPRDTGESPVAIPPLELRPTKFVASRVLANANHTVLYDPKTVRVVSGLISDFIILHITGRFDLSWQLQHLNRLGKWELKNLQKWQSVQPVSDLIAHRFRAMKTLREVDDEHSPQNFASKWGGEVKAIIDISKDNPAYDPRGLEQAGIQYHKLPSVSKIPPTDQDVQNFISLVSRLELELLPNHVSEGRDDPKVHTIGVHCHYGFNRTGFLIVSYLVEAMGMPVQTAIAEFAKARPPG